MIRHCLRLRPLVLAEEMERSQQRLAALEQEKVALLSRLQGQPAGAAQACGGQAEGGEGAADGEAAERGTQGSSSSRVAEDSLRQELYAQVWCAALCCALVWSGWFCCKDGVVCLVAGTVVWGRAAIHVPAPHARRPLACRLTTAVLTQLLALPVHVAARAGHAAAVRGVGAAPADGSRWAGSAAHQSHGWFLQLVAVRSQLDGCWLMWITARPSSSYNHKCMCASS